MEWFLFSFSLFVVFIVSKIFTLKKVNPEYLSGKVVWITGASSGIGKALAIVCAQKGSRLILSGRRANALQEVADECNKIATQHNSSPQIVAKVLPFDMSSEIKDIMTQNKSAEELWGGQAIDILINNAGISTRSPAEDTSVEVDEMVMKVDYLGPVSLAKSVLPSMLQRKSGHIVIVSSVQGRLPLPFRTSYSAAKHALHGYFESLRAEVVDRNVKVTMVLPGYVATNLSVNAIRGDGSAHGKMDSTTATGMSPRDLATKIVDALCRGDNEVIACDFKTKAAVFMHAMCPSFLAHIMAKRAKKGWKELRSQK